MKNSMKKALLGTGFAAAALISLSAMAWSGGHGGMDRDPGRMMAHIADRLDLSDSQRDQAEQIMNETREQTGQYREEMEGLRDQLKAMRGNFDQDSARAISERIGVVTGNLVYEMANTKAQIYNMLTPEQRTEMDEMMAKRDEKRDKWHKRSSKDSE